MTVTIAALVLRLARTTAAAADVPTMLTDVCRTTQAVLGVRAVLAAAGRHPAPGPTALGGSDETADRFARLQREARGGPLAAVIRSGRPLHTADLTRIGPPELAAAAAEAGLTTSFTVPLVAAGEPVGALQLLGDPSGPVGPELLEPMAAVLDVLAARLADVDELNRLTAGAAGPTDGRTESTTAVIRVAPPTEPPTGRHGEGRKSTAGGAAAGPGRRGEPGRSTGIRPGEPTRAGGSGPHEVDRSNGVAPGGSGPHEAGQPSPVRGGGPVGPRSWSRTPNRPGSHGEPARVEPPGLPGGARPEPPTERLPAAPTPPVPGAPAQRPSPLPRRSGPPGRSSPPEVHLPTPRHHEPGSEFSSRFGEAFVPPELPVEVSEPVVNGSAPGRRRRHGRDDAAGDRDS